ncbi:Pol, partial [Symbiodinium sp. CCMP2592]
TRPSIRFIEVVSVLCNSFAKAIGAIDPILHDQWAVDLLHIYQKPHNSHPLALQSSKTIRLAVWECIGKILAALPARNTVIMLGDFNTQIKPCAAAGTRICSGTSTGTHPPDQARLQHLVEDFSLLHLNSWCKAAGPTYHHNKGASLIDHIIMRSSQADDRARQARPLRLGLAAWRLGGYHLPLKASVPLQRFHTLNKPASLPGVNDLGQLHDTLIHCASQFFPPPAGQHRLALWQTPPMQDGIRSMWQAYRVWKTAKAQDQHNPLYVSRCYHHFKTAHKAFRRAGKEAKKHWFHGRLQELQAAASSGDSRKLYAGIRTLAPKSSKPKVQLRDSGGHLQDPKTQLKQLETHYRKLYAADEDTSIQGPQRTPIHIEVTEAEMTLALSQLSPHKATPPHLATNSLWRLTSDLVAPLLCQWCRQWPQIPELWRNAWLTLVPKIPRPLSPKNLRPIGLTESSGRAYASILQAKLRPYAERFLADQAQFAYLPGRNAAQAIHRVAAHCKYVQDRCSISTPTVVDRHAQQPKPCPHFAGAQLSLDLSSAFDLMDWRLLDKALLASEVPAELRHQIMSWHSEISYVLTHLGHTAKVEAQRGLRQGCKLAPLLWTLALAQIYRELLAEGDPLLTAPWLEQSSTIYADDIHLKDTVQTTRELDDMVYRFSKILDALAAHGMVINSAKSALLLRHKGSFIRGWLRRHLIPKPEGDLLRFRSPLGTVYEIPLRDHHTYLGIRISYHSQAKQAVTYRLQAANQAWQRLRGVLCSTRHLAQTHRLSLWKSTVLPTLLYGIAASNPGAKDIQRMQHMMTKQVRAITRSFAHLQKESTQDLLHRCSLSTILEHLQREAAALHRSLTSLSTETSFVTQAQVESARDTAATLHLQVQRQWQVPLGDTEGITDPAVHQCQECHRVFTSFRLLRSHEAKWHGLKTPAAVPVPFDRYAHGTEGLPTCRHCAHPFRQWDGLVKHIKRNRCQVLRRLATQPPADAPPLAPSSNESDPLPVPAPAILPPQDLSQGTYILSDDQAAMPPPAPAVIPEPPVLDAPLQDSSTTPSHEAVPLHQQSHVLETLRARRWTDLLEKPEIYSYLQHHCPLCYQWLATPTSIKYHLTMQHPEWKDCQPATLKLLTGFRRHTVVPCRYCHQRNINKDRHWKQCHQRTMTLGADPMELDEQERQFWAQAGPVKREQEPRRDTQDLQPLGSQDPDWMEYRMNRLSQLVLRQEQIISAIRQDLVLYLFVRSGPEGMVPVLCEAAEKWRKMKEEEPEKITYSLKLMLFKQLLITLHQRLTNMIADEDALAKAKNLNWIDDQKHWKHLTWNPTKQCLEVDNSVRPIPAEDLLAQLVQMRKAVTEETLVRFKSMRKLTTEVTSDWIQFQICMSLRPEGGAMWSTLNQWIGQASWHTLGCRLRRDRPNYDTLVQEAVLRLIFHNPSNLCYLHSTIYALLWTILQARLHDAYVSPPPQALTMLCPPITATPNCPIQVLHSVPWLMLLQAWPSVHRQHDAAELLQYLLPRFSHSGFNGGWEARNFVPGGIATLDKGPTQAPIPIALPAGPSLELQAAIDGWSAQVTARYALLTPSPMLCIQLQRFTNAEGVMRRDTRPLVVASTTVRMPLFTGLHTMQVRYVHYQVVAVQLHYGATPDMGHYRTILRGQPLFGAEKWWITDDSCTAKPVSTEHDDNIYIVWLRQVLPPGA